MMGNKRTLKESKWKIEKMKIDFCQFCDMKKILSILFVIVILFGCTNSKKEEELKRKDNSKIRKEWDLRGKLISERVGI